MSQSVVDYTECPICTERMTNPTFLPCFHTFCRYCVEELCDRLMPCPLCRKHFNAANGGELPTNVYVEELVRVSEVVENLEQNLSFAERRESCLFEQQQYTLEQLEGTEKRLAMANRELETCLEANTEATEQLKNAERQLEIAERLSDIRHQLLLEVKQTQRETEKQLNDALAERARFHKQFGRSKKEIESTYPVARNILMMLLAVVAIILWIGWSWSISIANHEVSSRTVNITIIYIMLAQVSMRGENGRIRPLLP